MAGGRVVVSLFVAGVVFGDLGLSLLQHECCSYSVFGIPEVAPCIVLHVLCASSTEHIACNCSTEP